MGEIKGAVMQNPRERMYGLSRGVLLFFRMRMLSSSGFFGVGAGGEFLWKKKLPSPKKSIRDGTETNREKEALRKDAFCILSKGENILIEKICIFLTVFFREEREKPLSSLEGWRY